MKVKELIEILGQQPVDADITVWIEGERLGLIDVDTSFVDELNFLEFNTESKSDEQVHCLKCDHVWEEARSPDVCPSCGNTDKQQTVYLVKNNS